MTDLVVTEAIAPRWAARRLFVFQVLGALFVGNAFKFAIAVALTPLIYALHGVVHHYLGPSADVDAERVW